MSKAILKIGSAMKKVTMRLMTSRCTYTRCCIRLCSSECEWLSRSISDLCRFSPPNNWKIHMRIVKTQTSTHKSKLLKSRTGTLQVLLNTYRYFICTCMYTTCTCTCTCICTCMYMSSTDSFQQIKAKPM